MKKLILASASPRRRELLSNLSIPYEVCVSDVEESVSKKLPAELLVKELALLKGSAVLKQYLEKNERDVLVIAADTVVTLHSAVLGKPSDPKEAANMLRALSGQEHEVYSGICVLDSTLAVCRAQKTKVVFKELAEQTIINYIKTGEPMDKAGAYGIQGRALSFVDRLEGDYYNVVGLPMKLLCDILKTEFGLDSAELCVFE